MILNKKGLKISVIDVVSVVVSVFFLVGITCWFGACGPKADGSYMNCHNAQIAVAVCGICLALLFLAEAFVRNKTARLILDAAALALCPVIFMIPGTLVHICLLSKMYCQVRLRPFAKGAAIFIALLTIWDIFQIVRNKPGYGSGEE